MTETEYREACLDLARQTLDLPNREAWRVMGEAGQEIEAELQELGVPGIPWSAAIHNMRADAWAMRSELRASRA